MPASIDSLTLSLTNQPHAFLQPTLPLYTDTLAYLKHTLDPLAADISQTQQEQLKEARRKRKRGEKVADDDVLRLKQIHTGGFTVEQVWEQVRRVIDAARVEAERSLEDAEVKTDRSVGVRNGVSGAGEVDQNDDDSELGEEGVDYEVEGLHDGEDDFDDVDDYDAMSQDESEDALNDEDIDIDDEEGMQEELLGNDEPAEEFVTDKFGLNDGFFSIDNFNRQSEFLEQQDARGNQDDGAASDEEDLDFDADPLAQSNAPNGDANIDAEAEDEGDDEDGPIFGDPDASSEDENDEIAGGEMDDMGGMSNTNHIMYKDFFAPPAQKKKKKNKKGRPNPHNFPEPSIDPKLANAEGEEGDDGMNRTMAAVHRDLFEDDESEPEADEEQNDVDPSDPKSRRSTHERRKAALAEEIRKLEAANVAKRSWTLSGEAHAADRPLNSLLEEDLDFERAGKPVPVITAEVSESIEDLIKRRILAHDFQDIIRRRPDDLATGGKDGRRGRLDFELDDSKSKKGLAEEYEEEYSKRTDPNFSDTKSEKQKKEEAEITALWNKIRSDLDSLSSWNFRPKAPAPQMDIRVDAPTITLEDARPNAGGEVAGTSQLAPQEVYRGGEGVRSAGASGEVVGKSGLPSSREEVGREERKRRRRREKERSRKADGNEGAKTRRGSEKSKVVGDLKKGRVRVIGKKGGLTDVEGKKVGDAVGGVAAGGQYGAGQYKL